MDVTKYNFEEELDSIKKVIEESTFLAIDGEFTGLSHGAVERLGSFDTPAERYKKIRNGASDFLLIQFGLCAFKVNESEKRYEARPYNFYIFPRPFDNQSPDRRFLCQSSSIDFLVSHDFDFNKVFKEGIPYLTYDQEHKARADLERKQAERSNSSYNSSVFFSPDGAVVKRKTPFVVPNEHKEFISSIKEKVDTYLKSEDTESLVLPPCNAFQRKLIYRSLEQTFPMLHIETKTGEKKERFLVVSRCNDAQDVEEKEKQRKDVERMKLDIQVGFSKVMRLITESGKLVVGHNMYLDVIHSINHFYTHVPQELSDFKEMISTIFPRLLDTKLLANTNPFKEYFLGTSLEELVYTIKHPPFKQVPVDFPEGFSKYTDEAHVFHEAGYDAYITGLCFASLINFLGRYQNPPSNFLSPDDHVVQPFVNKLFMMRIADIPYVDLSGPDAEPVRDHVFHVTFPEEWRPNDLHQLFEPYGNIHISWLTSTTAYVGLFKKDNAKIAMAGLCQGVGQYQVTSYSSHRQLMLLRSQSMAYASANVTPCSDPTFGSKRKSSSPDIVYPPTKLQRRSSLTKETSHYPSIPEEDEKKEEEEKNSTETEVMQVDKTEEDDDIGVALEDEEVVEERDMIQKEDKETPVRDCPSSKNDNKLFEEPDTW